MSTICTDRETICATEKGTIQQPAGALLWLARSGQRMMSWIARQEEKRLSRLALAGLTDDQLADIGVTPAEARRESSQSFWN